MIEILLITALITVESNGNPNAIGDNGLAYGCLQIHSAYVKDASEYAGKDWVHEDVFDPETAKEVFRAYMARYATERRLGQKPTYELLSRIHQGGPNGFKKSATDKYWAKVKRELQKLGVKNL